MKIINQTEALVYLKSGKTIVFPTETSYGLGCDATNQKAVNKIFEIKGRQPDKPLLVVVPTIGMAKAYLEWNDLLEDLAKKYWFTRRSESEGGPGPLTIVGLLKSKKSKKVEHNLGVKSYKLAKGVTSKFGTLAVRVTNADIPKYLSEKLGRPLVATSANVAGLGDIYYSTDVLKMFENRKVKPDVFLDAGILPKNPPTTIISVVGGELKVLRQGSVIVSK